MKRKLSLLLVVLMIFALFAGCGQSDEDENDKNITPSGTTDTGPVSTGTTGNTEADLEKMSTHPSDTAVLRYAGTDYPECWQQLTMGFSSRNNALVQGLLFDTLIGYDSNNNELVPSLATSWEWVDDYTLRLFLRDDATSVNGDKFTAKDVVYTITTGCTGGTSKLDSYYKNLFDLTKTKAVDDYTVDIGVLEKYPFLPLDLSHKAYMISVEASVDAAGGLEATKTNPICGTGPYKMISYLEGQVAKFERRADYWGVMPYYAQVEYYFVPDANTRALGLEAGDYDVVASPSTSTAEALASNDKYSVQYIKTESVIIFCINSDREPLNIKEIRQAMALAINYDALIQITTNGNAEKCDSIFTKLSEAYSEPADGANYMGTTDVNAAKAKLVEAGYPDGFAIDCHFRTTDAKWISSVEVLTNNFAQIGITLKPVQCETAVFYNDSESGNFDTLIFTNANPNPKRMIQNIDPRYSQHNCGTLWIPEGTQALLDKIFSTLDDTERQEYWIEFNSIVRENVPLIPLETPYTTILMSAKIVNVTTDTFGNPEFESFYEADYLG